MNALLLGSRAYHIDVAISLPPESVKHYAFLKDTFTCSQLYLCKDIRENAHNPEHAVRNFIDSECKSVLFASDTFDLSVCIPSLRLTLLLLVDAFKTVIQQEFPASPVQFQVGALVSTVVNSPNLVIAKPLPVEGESRKYSCAGATFSTQEDTTPPDFVVLDLSDKPKALFYYFEDADLLNRTLLGAAQ